MALDNLQVDYLIDPAFQIENLAGKPAVGGHIEVFEAGTDTKVITYHDFDGNVNPFKIPLHSDGRAVILADPSRKYDLYVYDSFNNLMFSRLNVTPNLSGNISITGSDVVIYNTDGTLDITQQSIQNNVRRYEINTKHKSFGVKEPLYFIEDSDSATIIGCRSQSGDYATTAYVESVISGKLDISSYSSQSGNFLTDKFEYDTDNNITAYNHSAFASNGETYSAGTNIDITDNVISVTGLPDIENAITSAITNIENKFEYNENNYITAYNNSAFAGTNYSAGDYVSIENNTISVTGLQPSGDYATHDDLTAYQPSGDYATKEDVESAVSGKQDILSAGDGIQIIDNTISVTAQGGGITVVNHDNTLSGDGNSTPLGLANAEDYVKQDDLTAYATTALVSSVSSELYSAFSGISGDYELVAGSGVELVDDPNAKTTTISVSGDYATNTQLQNVSADITGMVPSIVDSNTISYSAKPTADPIYAYKNDLINVNSIHGKSNLAIVPSDVLQVPNVITATTGYLTVQNAISAFPNNTLYVPGVITSNQGGLTAYGLSADAKYGLTANGLTADVNQSGFSANGITAGKSGPLFIEGKYESIYANNSTGFTFSSQNTAFGTAQLGTAKGNSVVQMLAPKFEARNISGAGFSIEASGAKGYDESGNVVWDTYNPQIKNIISYSDTETAAGGLNGNIILTTQPSTAASNLTSSPYVIMDASQASYFAAYGPSAQTPTVRLIPGTITFGYEASNAKTTVGYNDIKQELSGSSWTLTGSIQKRELEYNANTSAITAIAGSAIGGGGCIELSEEVSAATDYVTANSANIDATVSNVSANSGVWGGSALPISAGNGIKFELVNDTLVASVTSTYTSGYVWQSASLFHTDTPVTETTYTLSDNCSNYDRLEVDFYDVNNWRTVMECPIPSNLAASGTRGGYFSVVPEGKTTGANVWFKAFNWTAAGTKWSCYCSELVGKGGSTTQSVNANEPNNPPKVMNIIGWKRVGGN